MTHIYFIQIDNLPSSGGATQRGRSKEPLLNVESRQRTKLKDPRARAASDGARKLPKRILKEDAPDRFINTS